MNHPPPGGGAEAHRAPALPGLAGWVCRFLIFRGSMPLKINRVVRGRYPGDASRSLSIPERVADNLFGIQAASVWRLLWMSVGLGCRAFRAAHFSLGSPLSGGNFFWGYPQAGPLFSGAVCGYTQPLGAGFLTLCGHIQAPPDSKEPRPNRPGLSAF